MFTIQSHLEQKRYRSRHLIPMFIETPCIMTVFDLPSLMSMLGGGGANLVKFKNNLIKLSIDLIK